jgi:hypothetical protein
MQYLVFFHERHGFFLRKKKKGARKGEVHIGTIEGALSRWDCVDGIGDFQTVGRKVCTTDGDIIKVTKIEWLHPEIEKYKEKEGNILFTPPESKT